MGDGRVLVGNRVRLGHRHDAHRAAGTRFDTGRCHPNMNSAIGKYVNLAEKFVDGRLTAPDFERLYLRLFESEQRALSEDAFVVVERNFYAVEDYVAEPGLRTSGADLDDEGLRDRVRLPLADLRRFRRAVQ